MSQKDPRLQPRSLDSTLYIKDFAAAAKTTPARVMLGTDEPLSHDTCDFCNAVTHRKIKLKEDWYARYCQYHWKKYRKGTDDPRIDMSEEFVKFADKTWK